jgi:glucosyl-3-phosphoglycerate synthase
VRGRQAPGLIRTFHHLDFDAGALADAKGRQTVSVCLPARDEAATVGVIVDTIRRELVDRVPLVDEILVIDDHSTDQTAAVARGAGARVVSAEDVLVEHAVGPGKGGALWKSVFECDGDLIAWCDADVTDFEARFVVGLVGPLITRPEVSFVKGFYDRPISSRGASASDTAGGGRVTELVARPLVSLLFPHLEAIVQPLAGEYAGRRALLERLPFMAGYGVDLALLIDIAELEGTEAMAQVDLGTRHHRNRSLDELGPQALAVMQAALSRADVPRAALAASLVRPGRDPVAVDATVLPALVDVAGYQRRTA